MRRTQKIADRKLQQFQAARYGSRVFLCAQNETLPVTDADNDNSK